MGMCGTDETGAECTSEPLFHGVIPALLTPYDKDNKINTAAVKKMVTTYIANGATGFYVCGNTGEGDQCTVEERKQMTEAVKEVSGDVPLLIHVGACPVEDAVELAKHAESIGCAGTSSMPRGADKDEVVKYFEAVGAATKLPFYVYWVPSNVSNMQAHEFLEAVKNVENMAGIKFTDKDFFKFQQLKAQGSTKNGEELNCLTGPDEMMCGGLAMGSDGAIGSTYNILLKINVQMYRAFRAGDVKTATKCQARANEVINILLDLCGIYETGKGLRIRDGLKHVLTEWGFDYGDARDNNDEGYKLSAEEKAALMKKIEAVEGYADWKLSA